MAEKEMPSRKIDRRGRVVVSTLAAFLLVFALVHAIVAASGPEGETAVASQDDSGLGVSQEITPTVSPEDALQAYADAHYMTMDEAISLGLIEPEVSDLGTTESWYFPLLFKALPKLSLTATRPNSANDWSLSWTVNMTDEAAITSYQVQEAQKIDFSDAATIYDGIAKQFLVNTHDFTPNNVYYYRLRAMKGTQPGPWSDSVTVVGGYRDGFTSNTTGWDRRRVTHIDETTTFYENNKWLIVQSLDSWDWVIASPMKPAPQIPYRIEMRVQAAHLANLVSYGIVFGGDWNGKPCPDKSSVAGWYQHTACFNHFYNTNTIWYGTKLKLLFERVDRLVWCPTCGGSPMKRLGDIDAAEAFNLSGVDADGWNTYTVDVKADGIYLYANGNLQYVYNASDSPDWDNWINGPYFGIFASTDEYSNSTARVEYFQVIPLDN